MPDPASVLGVLFWLAQVTALVYILYRCLLGADSGPWVDFLGLMDGALERGASVIQGRRDSAEQHGLIPRGYAVNTTARNRLWHHARERAGFSGALTGSGICIKREILTSV